MNRSAARSNPSLTLVAMCIAQAMILLDNTIVNVALPSIQHDLVVTPAISSGSSTPTFSRSRR